MKGRFLEACILSLLKNEIIHGYSLLEKLIEYNLIEKETHISTIYRALRYMEKENLVTSSWHESDQGPNKRLYQLTTKGKNELDELIILMSERRKSIDTIISIYENND